MRSCGKRNSALLRRDAQQQISWSVLHMCVPMADAASDKSSGFMQMQEPGGRERAAAAHPGVRQLQEGQVLFSAVPD